MSPEAHEPDWKQVKQKLDEMAKEISNDLAQLESFRSRELLSDFVSELFLSMAEQNQKKRQAKAAAGEKPRGVRYGRPPKPLPENYPVVYQRWKAGAITGTAAARECGMPLSTFRYHAANYGKNHAR